MFEIEYLVQFQRETLEYIKKAIRTGYEAAKSDLPAEDIVSSAISILEDCTFPDYGINSVYNIKGDIKWMLELW